MLRLGTESVHVCFSSFPRAGWVDCWSVPNFLLIIDYTWHPIYPQKADEQLKQSRKLTASASTRVLTEPARAASSSSKLPFLVCVQSVGDGGVDAVGSAPPGAQQGAPQRPATLHPCVGLSRPQPDARGPLGAPARQTPRGDGNVPRFPDHPLRASAPSADLHQGTQILRPVSTNRVLVYAEGP